jgi:hypothetical protein
MIASTPRENDPMTNPWFHFSFYCLVKGQFRHLLFHTRHSFRSTRVYICPRNDIVALLSCKASLFPFLHYSLSLSCARAHLIIQGNWHLIIQSNWRRWDRVRGNLFSWVAWEPLIRAQLRRKGKVARTQAPTVQAIRFVTFHFPLKTCL